jgi:hypothetical protein
MVASPFARERRGVRVSRVRSVREIQPLTLALSPSVGGEADFF